MATQMTTLRILVAGVALAWAAIAAAQDYPAKPIRVVVPFPPGGAVDFYARVVQQPLSELLGQPIVIDNKAGASGMVGAEAVAKSAPDGYTLLLGNIASLAINVGIAVATPRRSPNAPGLPTIAESGLAGFEATAWQGLVGPAGMTPDVVKRLNEAFNQVMAMPAVHEKLLGGGLEPVGGTPIEFSRFIGSEIAKWTKIANDVGAKAE